MSPNNSLKDFSPFSNQSSAAVELKEESRLANVPKSDACEELGRIMMNKRIRTLLATGVLSAAGTLLSAGVAQAQAPARTYAPAPAGYTYRTYTSGGRNYYYYAPNTTTRGTTAYLVPNRTVQRAARSNWAPYNSSTYYDWSTSREVPMVKPWMRPYR